MRARAQRSGPLPSRPDSIFGLLARLTHRLAHKASSIPHAPPRLLELLRPSPPHLPEVVDDPHDRRQRRDTENSGGQESGDGESDGDDSGEDDGAEDQEERGGEGDPEEGAGKDQAGEAEEDAADGEEGDDGEYLGGGGAVGREVALYGVCGVLMVVLRHGDGDWAVERRV